MYQVVVVPKDVDAAVATAPFSFLLVANWLQVRD